MGFHDPREVRATALDALEAMLRASGQDAATAASRVVDAANATFDRIGDGATTTTVLASALATEAAHSKLRGESGAAIAESLQSAAGQARDWLQRARRPLPGELVVHVARSAAHQDTQIADVVATALMHVGAHGMIYLRSDGDQPSTIIEHATLLTPVRVRWALCESLREPRVVLLDVRGDVAALEDTDDDGPRLVISRGPAPSHWHRRGSIVVELQGSAAERAETLDDLAALTATTVNARAFGSVAAAHVRDSQLRLLGASGSGVRAHRAALVGSLSSGCGALRERLYQRIGLVDSRFAIIRTGSTESTRLRHVERAIASARAALVNGVVTGGGIALLRACQSASIGGRLLAKAAEMVVSRLVASHGLPGTATVQEVRDRRDGIGFDVEHKRVRDLDACGVWDAADVIEACLDHAVIATIQILERVEPR